ncbi:MAG TPA: hypothetical protein DIW81_02390 [Planctomycetaceae bacterium]|nr:hypothetical protein [Planctomycetaceae bacterium]
MVFMFVSRRVIGSSPSRRSPDFWIEESIGQRIRSALPDYRLSKFQPLMPPEIEQEVLFDYMLDRHQNVDWVRTTI